MLTPVCSRLLVASVLLASTCHAGAQNRANLAEVKTPGDVILVLPFDNRSGNPSLNWIGDSFPDTLNQRLSSAGFLTITRDDRLFALDHLGLPTDFRPSRATTIRIAQTLDADYVIVGSYNLQNGRISVQAQVLNTNKLSLSAPLEDSSELPRLLDVENAIAWKVARHIEPQFAVAEQTFLSASSGVQLSALENYIRGTDAPTSAERIKRLQKAVADSSTYAAAELALGKELYAVRDYAKAANVLAKVSLADRQALEANFYLGLARFNETRYAEAGQAFTFVASRLPLPEVVNDQGVSLARQNQDGSSFFQRASNADPNEPDYHYNLAVSYLKQGDFAGAQREIELTLKLRPSDTEAAELRTLISAGRSAAKAANAFEPAARLRRTYSEASFRQAAAQLDQMRALRMATLPTAQQSAEYTQLGRDYLSQGLLPEAEKEFNAAVNANPANSQAHAGLAQVRERSASLDDARTEALASLKISPSIEPYLILARIDLQKKEYAAAAAEVQKALIIEPKNAAALILQQSLTAHGQSFQ